MATDPFTSSTLLAEGSAGAEVLVNEMLGRLIASLGQVLSEGDTSPPGSPADFDAYILGASPTGAWSGQGNKIAIYLSGWKFFDPKEGMQVRVKDVDLTMEYTGTAWTALDGQQTLTDGATINWNMKNGVSAQVTIAGNRTMAAPTNIINGRIYNLTVIQDGTGTRLLTWNTVFKWAGGTPPTLSTGGGAIDVFSFVARGGNLYGETIGLAMA